MIDRNPLRIAVLGLMLAAGGLLVGCSDEGPAEQAGKQIDQTMDQAGEAADQAVEQAGDQLEQAGDQIESATDSN